MAIEKYTTSEKFEVLRGEEAQVLHEHRQRLGKSSLTDFDKDELDALEKDLRSVKIRNENEVVDGSENEKSVSKGQKNNSGQRGKERTDS